MCMSRLHQVVEISEGSRVEARDLDGTKHSVSLLAYDGPVPRVGDWLVVHSGFALGAADADDAREALSELGGLASREER